MNCLDLVNIPFSGIGGPNTGTSFDLEIATEYLGCPFELDGNTLTIIKTC